MVTNQQVNLEQEIIGGLFNNNNLVSECDGAIKPNMFQIKDNKKIYINLVNMIKEGNEVDSTNFLTKYQDKLIDMGGINYIVQVSEASPTESNFKTKLKLLADNYKVRLIIDMAKDALNNNNVEDLVDKVETTLKNVYEADVTKDVNIEDSYDDYMNWLYSEEEEEGIKSGLFNLDRKLGRFQKGRLITMFARSGIGKSTVAIDIAATMSKQNNRVFYGSGEMTQREVMNKIMASKCGIELDRVNNKNLTPLEKQKICQESSILMNNKFHVSNETDIDKFLSEVRAYKIKYGLDVLFVDYVNKYISGVKGNNLTEKIGEITSRLKEFAIKENVCVVMLAQANRKSDSENRNKEVFEKLTVSDIQDSARIEQDSDQIIALYRNKDFDNPIFKRWADENGEIDYSSFDATVNPEVINISVLKNRHGVSGTMKFKWQGEFSSIKNFA